METPIWKSSRTLRGTLTFSAVVEVGTAAALLVAPAFVLRLLIGTADGAGWLPLGRCFGIALLALAVACWPGREPGGGPPAFRGLLIYNGAIALYLGILGAAGNWKGLLLWPAVVVHVVIAVVLALLWRRGSAGN